MSPEAQFFLAVLAISAIIFVVWLGTHNRRGNQTAAQVPQVHDGPVVNYNYGGGQAEPQTTANHNSRTYNIYGGPPPADVQRTGGRTYNFGRDRDDRRPRRDEGDDELPNCENFATCHNRVARYGQRLCPDCWRNRRRDNDRDTERRAIDRRNDRPDNRGGGTTPPPIED